jgi:hypothetical protein
MANDTIQYDSIKKRFVLMTAFGSWVVSYHATVRLKERLPSVELPELQDILTSPFRVSQIMSEEIKRKKIYHYLVYIKGSFYIAVVYQLPNRKGVVPIRVLTTWLTADQYRTQAYAVNLTFHVDALRDKIFQAYREGTLVIPDNDPLLKEVLKARSSDLKKKVMAFPAGWEELTFDQMGVSMDELCRIQGALRSMGNEEPFHTWKNKLRKIISKKSKSSRRENETAREVGKVKQLLSEDIGDRLGSLVDTELAQLLEGLTLEDFSRIESKKTPLISVRKVDNVNIKWNLPPIIMGHISQYSSMLAASRDRGIILDLIKDAHKIIKYEEYL